MAVKRPTLVQSQEIASSLGLLLLDERAEDRSDERSYERSDDLSDVHPSTCPALLQPDVDCTGHPGMSNSCERLDKQSAGMVRVGRRCEEGTICRGADAFERAGDRQSI